MKNFNPGADNKDKKPSFQFQDFKNNRMGKGKFTGNNKPSSMKGFFGSVKRPK